MWYHSDTGADDTCKNRSHDEATQLQQPQIHMLKPLQEITQVHVYMSLASCFQFEKCIAYFF